MSPSEDQRCLDLLEAWCTAHGLRLETKQGPMFGSHPRDTTTWHTFISLDDGRPCGMDGPSNTGPALVAVQGDTAEAARLRFLGFLRENDVGHTLVPGKGRLSLTELVSLARATPPRVGVEVDF